MDSWPGNGSPAFEARLGTINENLWGVAARTEGINQEAYLTLLEAGNPQVHRESLLFYLTTAEFQERNGDIIEALDTILDGLRFYKDNEKLWFKAFSLADGDNKIVLARHALDAMPQSKFFIALCSGMWYETPGHLHGLSLSISRIIDDWHDGGRQGGQDSWLDAAKLLEKCGFPLTCREVVLTCLCLGDNLNSWSPVAQDLLMQGYPRTSEALMKLVEDFQNL